MMVRVRNASRSWIAKFVAGVIIFVLVLFGFGAFNLFAVNEPAVASINGEDITERQLLAAIDRSKRSMRQTYGDSVTDEQLEQFVNEEFTLRQIVDTELFVQASRDLELTLSDVQFQQVLRNDPQFQTEGEFDEELFRQTLERGGFSVQSLRGLQEESSVKTQLLRALEDTEFSTITETKLTAKFDKQVRDISSLEFKREQFEDPESITDDDIAAHYELNHDLYMTQGTFDFEYVEIKREQLLTEAELSDEEILALYDAEIAALQSEAKRRGRHLLIKVDENRTDERALLSAAELRQQIEDGASLSDLASELSDDAGSKADGGDLGFAERERYVKEFSDALWSLELDEVSAPVKTTFGYHIIQLLEIEALELASLEDRRQGLIEDHRLELATQELKTLATDVDKLAFEQSDSLQAIADDFSVEIQALQGVDNNSTDGAFTDSGVRSAFFESDVIDQGFNSRVVEVGDEALVVGRLTNRTEPVMRPLVEVSDAIKMQLTQDAAAAAQEAKFFDVLTQLRGDRNFDAAAISVGSGWIVNERQRRDEVTVDPAILDVAFAQPLPTSGERVIAEAQSEYAFSKFIVVVSRQELADYAVLEKTEQEQLLEASAAGAKSVALASFVASLRSEASIKTELFDF